MKLVHPVLGTLSPWRPELGIEFGEFATPTMIGLAKVGNGRLELLVIQAKTEGRGDCGRFLSAVMAEYQTVVVWAITSKVLKGMLKRRGFKRHWDDEGTDGMIWGKR